MSASIAMVRQSARDGVGQKDEPSSSSVQSSLDPGLLGSGGGLPWAVAEIDGDTRGLWSSLSVCWKQWELGVGQEEDGNSSEWRLPGNCGVHSRVWELDRMGVSMGEETRCRHFGG